MSMQFFTRMGKINISRILNKDILSNIFEVQDALKVTKLSRKAGVDKGTIADVLYNKTKNPGVYTVAKIADVFGCTIEELLSDSHPDKDIELKVKLAKECINAVLDLLGEEKQKITFDDFLLMIKTIYLNSAHTKSGKVDVEFAKKHIKDQCSKIS